MKLNLPASLDLSNVKCIMQDELSECNAVLIQPGYLWLDEWMSQLLDVQPLLTLCPSTLSALYCLTRHPSLS